MRMKLHDAPAPSLTCKKDADWFTAWLSVEELLPTNKNCLLERLLLSFDEHTGLYHNAPGVTIDSNVDFGNLGGIAYLDPSLKEPDYFHSLSSYLASHLNYTAGVDLHGAPYDWRYGPDGHLQPDAFYAKVKGLVEATYSNNGDKRVHIISHSLGGPTMLVFLNLQTTEWRSKYIQSFIPIAPPFQGASAQVVASISGSNFGIPLVPSDYLYPVQSSAPSGVFLWPTAAAFGDDVPLVFSPSKNYTARDLVGMNAALNNTKAVAAYNNLRNHSLDLAEVGHPGVTTHVIYSHGVKTPEKFHFDKELDETFDHSPPTQTDMGDGDGTVNLQSVLWAQTAWQGAPNLSFFNVSGASHFGLMTDSTVLDHVKQLIAQP